MSDDTYSIEELHSRNNPQTDRPIIAYCPDWRRTTIKHDVPSYQYSKLFVDIFENIFEHELGAKLHYLSYEEKISEAGLEFDGCFISGGRDIDPSLYNENNVNTDVPDAIASCRRWKWCEDALFNSNPKMPVFGICYGLQVLNCIYGGKMQQEIANCEDHQDKLSRLVIQPGSHIYKAIGGFDNIAGMCYHSQTLGDIPEQFRVTARSEIDGLPHALEWDGDDREIFSVLWHPEFTKKKSGEYEQSSFNLFKYFVERCSLHKVARLARKRI